MNKKFLPLLGLILLGIGFAACMLAYAVYTKDSRKPAEDTETASKTQYEMPRFVPVVHTAM